MSDKPKIKDVVAFLERIGGFDLKTLKEWDQETEVLYFGNTGIPKEKSQIDRIFNLDDNWAVGI